MTAALSERAGCSALSSRKARLCLFVLLCVFCLAAAGCKEEQTQARDEISLAEDALRRRDTGDAEMYFERYLRKFPQGELRWHVWEQLLQIALDLRQDRKTARDYLEIMLLEFGNEPERRREIQLRLAALCNEMRDYGRAGALWEALVQDPGLPDKLKAPVYRDLAHIYLRRLEFIPATDTLEACLTLQVDNAAKAACMYDLGEAQTLTENLTAAEASFRSILEMQGIPEERRVLTTFLLADVLEQQGNSAAAISYFESIRASYPNEKVVEMRIAHLKKIRK